MTKMKKILCFVFAMVMVVSCMVVTTSASSAYQTYVYDINGKPLYSPDAYTAHQVLEWDDMGLDSEIKNPDDLVYGRLGRGVTELNTRPMVAKFVYGALGKQR